ncbi:MAG TPA: class I SAM-dependent methyltransferase [Candidatus Eisenbacteria bacterium]|nr:class I SAM-dependent methyltransferase [Candidatus Eisenbacteria bacterium]
MLREGYEVTATYEATHWWFRSRRDLVLRQVTRAAAAVGAPGRRLRLLDYGCGTGFNLPWLARFGEVAGADVADEALREFQKTTGYPLLDLRDDLGAHHGRYDIVLALDVLEHCDDDVEGLRAMERFVAPGGQLVLTVPAYRWLWSGEDVISRHRRRYTRRMLVGACERAGLQVLYASYFNLAILPAVAAVVWTRRLLDPAAREHSNLRPTAPWLNETLYRVTSSEARWVGDERLAMPAGASLVARLARAKSEHAAVA